MARDRKTVLVLGGRGRLGRFLFRAWQVGSSGPHSVVWHAREAFSGTSGRWLAWDLLREEPPAVLEGEVDVVLNLSGVVPGGKEDLSLNSKLALTALNIAQRLGAGLVFHLSSAAVYGDGKFGWREGSELCPVSQYGWAKLDMERVVFSSMSSMDSEVPSSVILRLGNVVGADQLIGGAFTRGLDHVVRLDQFSDGSGPVRSYIGPQTFAEVLQGLIARGESAPKTPSILNVAAPNPVSMESLLNASGIAWEWRPAGETAQQYLRLDVAALSDLFSFAPRHSDPGEMVREWRNLCDG